MISVRVLRPCLHGGRPLRGGELVSVDPLSAGDLIDYGKAELVDAGDVDRIRKARADELRRVMRTVSTRGIENPGSPWTPIWPR
jgi:hypothetical protein